MLDNRLFFDGLEACDVAVAREGQVGFPADAHWQNVLGVDLARVEASLSDREAVERWLSRQSDELISRLEDGAGLAALNGAKKERAARLMASEAGRHAVRQALLCRHYLVNRRREALDCAVRSIAAQRPSLADVQTFAGDWVRVALRVADEAPELLLWFALWDRAFRVSYREYRLAGASGEGLRGIAGGVRIDGRLVDRAIRSGFDPESFRFVDVIPDAGTGAHLVFVLHGAGRSRVRTLDGVRHVGRAQWIILRLDESMHRLLVHSSGELGARLAEAILAEALGTGSVAYRPHRPQTDHEVVASWAERLVQRDGEQTRLHEIDLVIEQAPQVTWRIQGDVPSGLALLERATGAEAIAGKALRVGLGFREVQGEAWSRFTVWVRPGSGDASRIVTYQGHGVSPAERRAFVTWMQKQGVSCAPA